MKIFTIHDGKAKFYGQPFYARTKGEAIRSFGQAVNAGQDPNNLMAAHPADFSLFEIGEFDEQTGLIKPLDAPAICGSGVDFKQQ